jgi:LuxR family transcriptional regulator, maltose regulon positive regulatory protein
MVTRTAAVVERRRLFDVLTEGIAGPVTVLTGPAGSGKSTLLSSWRRDLDQRSAQVTVPREERDANRFWNAVMDALRDSGAIAPGDPLATLAPAPLGDRAEFVERLVEGLDRLPDPVVLVIDDLHELRSDDARRELEAVLGRTPAGLRTVVSSRRDPQLGLHRMRLAGELTEIRAADLGFTAEETAELIAAAGVVVDGADVARLHERTEGWAAGLRLAAMSLARHDDPDRFVAEFSGSERTVADYLVGEVLSSQPPEVRHLLLRTCILDRVTGPLADALTGRADSARLLHELEEANALVVAVDVARSWFRYHHLLADLLRLQLRLEAPEDVAPLHCAAARWHADHGDPVEAIRHAQLGRDWELARELLARHWVHLVLDGEEATVGALLSGLPSDLVEHDAEMATVAAVASLAASRWAAADAGLAAAEDALAAIPAARRRRAETALATASLLRARRVGDMDTVIAISDAVQRAGAAGTDDGRPAGDELEALALMNLGIAESWVLRLQEAEAHLNEGLALGRRAGRPYLEIGCLGALGTVANILQRLAEAEDHLRGAAGVAGRVGWSRHPIVAATYLSLAAVLIERAQLDEAGELLARADPILAEFPEPAAAVGLRHVQGMLAIARDDADEALARFCDGERLAGALRVPHFLMPIQRQWELRARLRLGELDDVRDTLSALDPTAQTFSLTAYVRLLDGDPNGAAAAVAPVLAGEAFAFHVNVEIEALLLDARARTALGERDAAHASVERALALGERQGHMWLTLAFPGIRELLAAHELHRTAHASRLKLLLDHLSGTTSAAGDGHAPEPSEPLSDRELAVLRFLPTNLSAAEIGSELFLSVHTVKTHMRKLYAKLDVHTRAEAVQRGRALGLLAPPVRRG